MHYHKIAQGDDGHKRAELSKALLAADDGAYIRYEGGEGTGGGARSRLEKRYGDDVRNFKVKEASGIESGLKENRGCTDVLCLIVWLLFLGSMMGLTIYSKGAGNLPKLIASVDGNDKMCGQAPMEVDYKYLYLTDFSVSNIMDIFSSGVCVKECPKATSASLDYVPTEKVKAGAALHVYESYQVLTYCIPDVTTLAPDQKAGWGLAVEQFINSSAGSYFNDLYLASTAIWISIGMALVYCFLFIVLMKFCAEYLAWATIIIVQVALFVPPVVCYLYRVKGQEVYAKEVKTLATDTDQAKLDLLESFETKQFWLLVAVITFSVIASIMLCCVICGYKSLKLAIDVIDASADFLFRTQRLLLVQLLFYVITIVTIVVWLGAIFCVISLNDVTVSHWVPQAKHIQWDSQANFWLFLYMIFGILWICAWIDYSNQFIIQVSAVSYYFDSNAETTGSASVCKGFHFAYLNHMGSLAFGALIIAIIRFIKIVIIEAAQMAAKSSGENAVQKAVLRCGVCYLQCLEKITDYINESAFSYMAVSGESFLSSAWNGFLLNVKHVQKFAFSNSIAAVFIFLGKIGITVGNCFSLVFIMKTMTNYSLETGAEDKVEEVQSILAPVVVVGVCTYLTSIVFLNFFDTAVLSLMTAMAIDLDLNGELKYGPPTFHESMTKIASEREAFEEEDAEWRKNAEKYL